MGKLIRLELFSRIYTAIGITLYYLWLLTIYIPRLQVLQRTSHPSLRRFLLHLDNRAKWIGEVQFVSWRYLIYVETLKK